MYECPGCGANLKFDIISQQMACAYCGIKVDPYSLQKEQDAEQEDTFEVTKFSCPQCGGEMISGDQDATAFCSFCGAANILTARLTREKRPGYIIPFKKNKEDCKAAYARKLKRAFFAPRELRDPAYIDSFRGIYMPYWTYRLEQQGYACFKGTTSYRKGDYVYTEHYDLTGNLDGEYYGFSYDASSTFYDNISEALAPFHVEDQVDFTPAYLSGFYADTADVGQELYLEQAEKLANESSWEEICKEPVFKKYNIQNNGNKENLTNTLHTRCSATHSTMYPVWFLSWRKEDRVAYATVNGQTGKVVADLPIDIKQFLKGALVLAVPLFILLNLLGTMKPYTLLGVCCLLGLAAAGIYLLELRTIRRRESHVEDPALAAKRGYGQEELAAMPPKEKKSYQKKRNGRKRAGRGVLWVVILYMLFLTFLFQYFVMAVSRAASAFLPLIATIASVVLSCLSYRAEKKLDGYRHCFGPLTTTAALIVSLVICYLNPVSDLWYYLGAVLILLAVLYNILDILRNYNRMAMRRLPQFDKQGGDDCA